MAQKAVDTMKITTLFSNMENAAKGDGKPKKKAAKENTDEYFVPDGHGTAGAGSKKRLSIERIYQKKTQLEHILLRPDTYVGSIEATTQSMWVLNEEGTGMILRDLTYVPGLYKIFDEILVNAADNKQRDPKMNCLKIDIDPEANKIKVWNNGRGIPVVEHKEHEMYVPTMIFGHLLTSSNYDDSEKKVTGGRNGYGAKLCNIFSNKFIVETSYKECRKSFKQTWSDNMGKRKDPIISDAREEDFTAITFYPDLSKFKMEKLDKDTVDLFTRRAYDIAASSKGVRVVLNGKRVPVKNFKDYVDLFVKDKVDEMGAPIKVVHDVVSDRWEVAVTLSEKGFQQASFVNSIATTKGGRHVDHVADQIITKLLDVVKKKNKGGVQIKPFQVKNHMWVFVNCLIENPSFDSQTKENMTLQVKSFGSKCVLNDKFITNVSKCGITESILSWMKFKAQAQLNRKCVATKQTKLKGVPKLDDANDAGTKNSSMCTLILTEGDSAKTLAVAGLGVVGRDRYGVFPLRGKCLNVRDATHKQIMDNAEINNIIKIMGLQFKQNYDSPEKLKTLRYGKIMIMTDQDVDGSHIKGLLINFIHHYWPSLLKQNVIVEFITPIVKVNKGKEERAFYSLPEFEEWKSETSNWNTWKIKYYKGLGTSTSKEAKEYFSDMVRHKIDFRYSGGDDDASITLAFSKKKIEERKEWLSNFMEERKQRSEMGLPPLYLYDKHTRNITFSDFINRELILFSNTDLERSIPSLVDGLKPGQRKCLFTCLKRNLVNKEIKVAQLAGSIAELSAYHHGEASLMGTLINLAQNFVGSNNLNLLLPIGQFGTRLHGGKDASSPRYIFTMLSSLTRMIFNVNDEPILDFLFDDNQRIEPTWYCPIIPMVLVNGAEGIGTGWSTKIPNYDVREVVANLIRLLDGDEPLPMLPTYKNFKGTILEISDNKYLNSGEISIIDDETVEITELPVKVWTQNYKEGVMEPMLMGTETEKAILTDYKEYHTDTTVRFVCKLTPEKLAQCEDQGLHKAFKLQTTMSTNTMVLFDPNGCVKRYNKVEEILQEFYVLRLEMYKKRKSYLEGMLAAESLKLDNIARFILEKIEGTVTIENKKKKDLIETLVRRGYDSDPVKAWKDTQNKGKLIEEDLNKEEEETNDGGPDFNYILSMPLWNLTKEKKDELCKKRDAKAEELSKLRKKSSTDLWRDDLEEFLAELDRVEQKEREDDAFVIKDKVQKTKGGRAKKVLQEALPSPHGRRVEPRVDSAIKVKAEKEAIKRMKAKIKKEGGSDGNILDFFKTEDDEDSKEPLSLADRLKQKGSPVNAIKAVKEKKPAKEKKEKKASSPKKAPSSGSPKKKGGKKRNPWSDSESEGVSDLSDADMDGSFLEGVYCRENAAPRRAAAKKASYVVDIDIGENEDDNDSDSDDDNVKVAPKKTTEKMDISDVDDDDSDNDAFKISDDDSDFGASKKPAKKAPAKKAPPPKKTPAIISDSEDDLPSINNNHTSQSTEDDEWLKITGQTSNNSTSQQSSSPSPVKSASEPAMFDDSSDAESVSKDKENNDLLFKPVASLKPKPKADKKPPAEKKPRAPAKKKAEKKETKPKKAPAKKKKNAFSDSESDEDLPKKKPAKRPKQSSDFEDSDDEFAPKKKKVASKKKKADSDSESEVDDAFKSSAAAAARGGGRARKTAVKYTFDDSDEDDDF